MRDSRSRSRCRGNKPPRPRQPGRPANSAVALLQGHTPPLSAGSRHARTEQPAGSRRNDVNDGSARQGTSRWRSIPTIHGLSPRPSRPSHPAPLGDGGKPALPAPGHPLIWASPPAPPLFRGPPDRPRSPRHAHRTAAALFQRFFQGPARRSPTYDDMIDRRFGLANGGGVCDREGHISGEDGRRRGQGRLQGGPRSGWFRIGRLVLPGTGGVFDLVVGLLWAWGGGMGIHSIDRGSPRVFAFLELSVLLSGQIKPRFLRDCRVDEHQRARTSHPSVQPPLGPIPLPTPTPTPPPPQLPPPTATMGKVSFHSVHFPF